MHGFVRDHGPELLAAVQGVVASAVAAFDYPGGHVMSVAMSWCGNGWTSDSRGYRYSERDARSGKRWPAIPHPDGAGGRSRAAGGLRPLRAGLLPDEPLRSGSKLSLHQDKDEHDFGAPIVSVSLGLPAVFQFGGLQRSDRARRIPLAHGDVVVWGGPARLCFHGILPVKEGYHSLVGPHRINITLRKAL